jgi:hypothetical protein
LLATDDVQAMLRAIVGAPEPEQGDTTSRNPDAALAAEAAQGEPEASADPQMEEAAKPGDKASAPLREVPASAEQPATTPARMAPTEMAQVRRHGRATPF